MLLLCHSLIGIIFSGPSSVPKTEKDCIPHMWPAGDFLQRSVVVVGGGGHLCLFLLSSLFVSAVAVPPTGGDAECA